ncbi:MAG: GMP/IMP nucleotidase [Gammaproteobacteria bacterium]
MHRDSIQTWRDFDTILLDMDGTILDLAFDNYFWLELVPRSLARSQRRDPAAVRADLFARFAQKQGTLEWYCLDYWSAELSLDLRTLKSASSHRVCYLAGASEFLQALRATGKTVAVVTNAHLHTLEIKKGVAGLGRWIDTFVSSHDFGAPKESPVFWAGARQRLDFDPARTLFIDDSQRVLDAAVAAGIGRVLAISRPDSCHPVRQVDGHLNIEALGTLLQG